MEQNVLTFLKLFTSIIWEAFPFIVLGRSSPAFWKKSFRNKPSPRSSPRTGFWQSGWVECLGGLPDVRMRDRTRDGGGRLRKGLPLGTCVSYMMAGPIINVVVISTTIIAFEGFGLAEAMTTLRVGRFLVAFVTGLIVEMQFRKYGNSLLTPVARPQKSLELNLLDVAATPDVHPADNSGEASNPFRSALATSPKRCSTTSRTSWCS